MEKNDSRSHFPSSLGTSITSFSGGERVRGRGKAAHSLQRPGLHPGSLVLQNDPSPATAIAAAQQPAWNPCCHPPPHWHTSSYTCCPPPPPQQQPEGKSRQATEMHGSIKSHLGPPLIPPWVLSALSFLPPA